MIRSIALPTDFSEQGQFAFAHALRLALLFRSRLDLLHVRPPADNAEWGKFPHVRETLERWGMLPAGAEVSDIQDQLGLTVHKVDVRDGDAADGIARYVAEHGTDLLVMATHGRTGLNRWLSGSVSTELVQQTRIPTLLFGPRAQPFVDPASGRITLSDVAMPVDHSPSPSAALIRARRLLEDMAVDFRLFHAGSETPDVYDAEERPLPVTLFEGGAVEAIVAESTMVGLIAMPTAGRHGFLDAVRGSTTERVLHDAACPILALHAGG